jgi:hypothetical protein
MGRVRGLAKKIRNELDGLLITRFKNVCWRKGSLKIHVTFVLVLQ